MVSCEVKHLLVSVQDLIKPQHVCLLMLKTEFYAIKYCTENCTLKDF